MDARPRTPLSRTFLILLSSLIVAVAASAEPADPGSIGARKAHASISGVVVSRGAPVADALVSVASTGDSVRTDSHGRFALSGFSAGPTTLFVVTGSGISEVPFKSQGGHSRAIIAVGGAGLGGSAAVLLPIIAGGHDGAEIEGAVTANDGTSLTVHDDELGDVVVTPDTDAVIRHGDTLLTLADITVGMTVHAKASLQGDGTYLASEIIVQDESNGAGDGESELSGVVKSIDCTAGTMVLTTESGDVNVVFDPNTVFKSKGQVLTCDDVAVGDDAEVEGTLQADQSVLAAKVTFEAPETEDVEVEGTVKSVSAPDFVVTTESGDVTVHTDGSTQFFKDGHDPATFSDVVVGVEVSAEGALQADSSVLASKVHINTHGGDD